MRTAAAFALGLVLASAPALTGCGRANEDAASTEAGPLARYVVRAQVAALPDPASPMSDFMLRHEAIPAFKSNANETEPHGMNAMTMPFPLAEGVSLDGLTLGDAVTVEFTVRYGADDGEIEDWEVISLEKLPAGTELHFGPAPGADTPPATHDHTADH